MKAASCDERDARALADLSRFRATALRIAARGQETFFDPEDDILRLAARSVVINVAAAVDRLSEDFRAEFDDVPWAVIRSTRNYVAHAYDQVNDRVIWTAGVARPLTSSTGWSGRPPVGRDRTVQPSVAGLESACTWLGGWPRPDQTRQRPA